MVLGDFKCIQKEMYVNCAINVIYSNLYICIIKSGKFKIKKKHDIYIYVVMWYIYINYLEKLQCNIYLNRNGNISYARGV